MKNLKISFLIPAHNEEKIIAKPLENLLKLPYNDYEVLIGLDGCTDNTENIVKYFCKKSKKFRYYKLNLRQGKPAVINSIIKHAKGDIIIINDADWIFKVRDKETFEKFLSVFDNSYVGGIGESFSIQYPTKNKKLLEAGVGVQTDMWINYLKSKAKKFNSDWMIANNSEFPFLVNIFRKNLYQKNITLADDFERFFNIVKKNKLILVTNNPNLPRMISIGENYTLSGILKQKERTALARNQIGKKMHNLFGFDFILFIIKHLPKLTIKELVGFFIVNLIFILATIKSKFKKQISTREGWKMRLKR